MITENIGSDIYTHLLHTVILSDAFTTYIRMLCFGKINEFRQTWIKYAFALVLWNIHISTIYIHFNAYF